MTVALPASPRLRSALLFVLVGFVLRLQFLGNPLQHVDEQFYLLVAERMGHGVLPYVDIWDRKPLGLFLIYRLAFVLPGDPVVVMQLLGLASAAATALVVERMAQTIADARAARISGLAYLAFMPVFGCGYAQAQVFYNLPVAMAALLVVRAATRPDRGPHWRDAMLAMLLLGLAMQIKYTVVFEGVGLGLILLWRAWADRVGAVRFVAVGAVCAGLAVLPTLAVWAWYASQGHGPEFAFANFLSIAGKGASVTGEGRQIFHVILILSPLAAGVLCGPVSGKAPRVHAALRWWMLACFFGYLAFGRWHDHYVSPLLAPLAVLAAPLLAQARWYRRLMLAMCVIVSIVVAVDHGLDDPRTSEARAGAARIAADLHGGCLYIYQGPTAFYRLTRACTVSRFVFPDHLATSLEARSIGIDPVAEVRRIMAARPAVVLVDNGAHPYMPNLATRAVVDQALRQDYTNRGDIALGNQRFGLWALRR
jgi:hypothetical protein